MKQTWQIRLAVFAKKHPALKPPVYALLWLGLQLSALATSLSERWERRRGRPADAAPYLPMAGEGPAGQAHHRPWLGLRVVALSLALFVMISQLPSAAYHMEGAPDESVEQEEEPLPDSSETAPEEEPEDPPETSDPPADDSGSGEAPGGDSSEEPGEEDSDTGGDSSGEGPENSEDSSDMEEPGEEEPEAEKVIIGFMPLAEDVRSQTHTPGTPQDKLRLPAQLTAILGVPEQDEPAGGEETPGDQGGEGGESAPQSNADETQAAAADDDAGVTPADESLADEPGGDSPPPPTEPDDGSAPPADAPAEGEYLDIPVSWQADPPYDPYGEGAYHFTPLLPQAPALAEGVALPAITVALEESNEAMATGDVIYVDKPVAEDGKGNNSNDGSTIDTPVATVADALQKVNNNGKIVLMDNISEPANIGIITKKIEITSLGTPCIVTRDAPSVNGYFLQVGQSQSNIGSLELTNVTLSGDNKPASGESALIRVSRNSTLKLENVVLEKNNSAGNSHGGALFCSGAATMQGASRISGNSAVIGGGVYVDNGGVFNLESGTITGNTATDHGGGVGVSDQGSLTLNGGSIIENTATTGNGQDLYVTKASSPGIVTFASGTVGTTDGGYYTDLDAQYLAGAVTVTGTTPSALTVYCENTSDGSENGPPIAVAPASRAMAARFLSVSGFLDYELSQGIISGGYIVLSPPAPVILHFYTETHASYEPYYEQSLAGAITNSNNGPGSEAYITLRKNITATAGETLLRKTTLRSEGDSPFTLTCGGTLFTLGGTSPQLVVDNITLSTGSAVPIVVNGGTLSQTGGSIISSGGGVTLQNGQYNHSGGSLAPTGGNTLTATGGSYNLSDTGAVSGGTGISLTGNAAMTIAGGTITGVKVAAGGASLGMTDGAITGGGVVLTAGSFAMEGGSITGSTGAGVQVDAGSFTLSGTGSITGSGGAGVLVNSTAGNAFTMQGGGITANASAPGLHTTAGTSTLEGGSITGNGYASGTTATKANVYLAGGTLNLDGGSISGTGSPGDGIYQGGGTLNVKRGTISGHGTGSGVHTAAGSLNVTGGTIQNNQSADGGGIYVGSGVTFSMTGGTISENTADDNGGGLYLAGDATLGAASDGAAISITDNQAQNGGGIYSGGRLTLQGSGTTITKNTADGNGGGVYSAQHLSLAGATIGGTLLGNTAAAGGGVYAAGVGLAISSGGIIANQATTSNGGGAYVSAGGLNFTGGTVASNSAEEDGGGIYVNAGGAVLTSAASLEANMAGRDGGGLYLSAGAGTQLIYGGSFKGNQAGQNGGGLCSAMENDTLIIESAIFGGSQGNGNTATGDGGAIYVTGSASTLTSTNISYNRADNGGGVYQAAGTLAAGNAMITNNTADDNGGGLYTAGDATLTGSTYLRENTATDGTGSAICLDGASLTLDGGAVGDGQFANGVGRKDDEVIRFTANFVADTNLVVLEKAGGAYAVGDPIYQAGDQTTFPDWFVEGDFTDTGATEAQVGERFWAVDDEGKPLRGTWIAAEEEIRFMPATIRILYTSDTPNTTTYAATLENAFELVAAKATGLGQRVEATIYIGEDVSTAGITVEGNVQVTLASGEDGTFAVARTGTGSLFTVNGADTTLVLGDVTLDGDDRDTGSLVQLTSGSVRLGSAVTFQNNDPADGNGAALSATGGTLVVDDTPGLSGLGANAASLIHLAGTANMQLAAGSLGKLSLGAGSPKITIGGSFTAAQVEMVHAGYPTAFAAGAALDFLDCPPALKATAAPCFTAAVSGGTLVGGVDGDGVIRWMDVEVNLELNGSGALTPHTSLGKALEAIPSGAASAVITLLKDITTGPVEMENGTLVTISPSGTADTITRATGATGHLITVPQGTLVLGAGLVVDGAGPGAGGALAALESGAHLRLNGSLQNNQTTTAGGGVYNNGGTLTMGAGAAITGNSAQSGGGVYQAGGGAVFNLNGGSITGNRAGSTATTTTAGSGVHIAAGKLQLNNAPTIGQNLTDNNLLNEARDTQPILLQSAFAAGALIHVGGPAAQMDEVATSATPLDTDGAAKAAAFRHTGDTGLIGQLPEDDDTRVVWGSPKEYPLTFQSSLSFVCEGPMDKFLYLLVDGTLMTPGDGGNYTVSGTTSTSFAISSAWAAQHTPDNTRTGYYVVAVYADGYGRGSANSIRLLTQETTSYHPTLTSAIGGISAGGAGTVTLLGSTTVTGVGGNTAPTIANKRVTITSEGPDGDDALYSVLRGSALSGALFTLQNGATLTLDSVVLDGQELASVSGSLIQLDAGTTATLNTGALLQNNRKNGPGAGVNGAGALVVDGGVITKNAGTLGGAVFLSTGGTLTLTSGQITANTAATSGGAIANAGGTVTLAGGEVSANTTTGHGGAVYQDAGTLNLAGTAIGTNRAGQYGGGLAVTGGTVNLSAGEVAGDNVTTGGIGVALYLKTPAVLNLTGGSLAGIALEGTDENAIQVKGGFNATGAAYLLEGMVSNGSLTPITEGQLVATYAAALDDDLPLKQAAANCFSYGTTLRGDVTSDERKVIMADASSVRLDMDGESSYYSSIDGAIAFVGQGKTATITLLKDVVMQRRVTVGAGRTVTLAAEDALRKATRATQLKGDLFTVEGGSLTLGTANGESLVVDGNKAAIALVGGTGEGSLVHLKSGSLTLTSTATLQNNSTNGNGGGVKVAGGTFTVTGGLISGNQAVDGGGLYYSVAGGTLALAAGGFTGNTASRNGGGVHLATGTLAMGGGTFTGNTGARGGEVYLAQGARMELSGGQLGNGTAGQGLYQQLAGLGAPSLTVAGALASTHRADLSGRNTVAEAANSYQDNDLAALFKADALSYAQQLASAKRLFHTGTVAGLNAVLNPEATGALFRRYIEYTEPLYNEHPTAGEAGADVRWDLTSDAGAPGALAVTVNGSAQSLTLDEDYTVNGQVVRLTTSYLDSLENGTYAATITTGSQSIATGFTVQGSALVQLRVGGGAAQSFRSLAAAIKAAPTGQAATITPLANLTIKPTQAVDGGRQITITGGGYGLAKGGAGDLFTVADGASLTFGDITIDGGGAAQAGGTLVKVEDGGSLTLAEGAILRNNHNDGDGGAVNVTGGSFTMAGGEITGNQAPGGGGLAVSGGQVTLEGGRIYQNTATQNGGGLQMTGGALTAGAVEISGNSAVDGGGLHLSADADFTARQGLMVTGNTASGQGAGAWLDENASFTQFGGSIGDPLLTPLDNGIWFNTQNPPKAGAGFRGQVGNLNLEGMTGPSGSLPFGDPAIPVMAPPADADYPTLADIAEALRYAGGTATYNAVAIPDANGNFTITTQHDLFECFTLYRRVESDPLVYWRFGNQYSEVDLKEVHVDGQLLPADKYQKASGSIRITLAKSYLHSLKSGVYTLEAYLTGDTAAPSFTFYFVVQRSSSGNNQSSSKPGDTGADGYDGVYDTAGALAGKRAGGPQTGDATPFGPWMLTALAGLVSMLTGLVMLAKRRRREKQEDDPAEGGSA